MNPEENLSTPMLEVDSAAHANCARLSRRTVLKWFAAAAASAPLADFALGAAPTDTAAPLAPPGGYGPDPDLSKIYHPGQVWPLTFTPGQRAAATALADLMLPADHLGPAASDVRVPDYLDEWIS